MNVEQEDGFQSSRSAWIYWPWFTERHDLFGNIRVYSAVSDILAAVVSC